MVTLSRCVLALVVLGASARADVLVVDPAGGPGGALLQSRIQAAHDGDILLLRAGDYTDADTVINGKLLSLVADPAGAQVTLRRLTVNMPPTLDVTPLLRGLTVLPPLQTVGSGAAGMSLQGPISNSRGLWVEDCRSHGSLLDPDGPGGLPHVAGAGIFCGLLNPGVIVRCQGTGADGFDAVPGEVATGGGKGLETIISSTSVQRGLFTGGQGGDGAGDGSTSTDGGDGVRSVGNVSIMGATMLGGDEGANDRALVFPGPGLRVQGGGSIRDVHVHAGAPFGGGGISADIVLEASTTLTTYPAAARDLEVASPLREHELGTLKLHGVVGDAAWVYADTEAGVYGSKPAQGWFVLGSFLVTPLFVGTISDASGNLDVGFHMPELPSGVDGLVVFLQSAMKPVGEKVLLGSGSALVWVSAAL